jgi:CubicO group peptidase (beta-lactamase class C family)
VVRNPSYPDEPITYRQLLTHTSSINDGAAYEASYACGDPTISLRTWIEGYLAPGGTYYNETENFHSWKPGQRFDYSNVGFGLLGYLVEVISGFSFSDFCKANIFEPLGMDETSWYLADLDKTKHALPYTYVTSRGKTRGDLLQEHSRTQGIQGTEGFVPNCLYSFPNYPDGLLRTSVHQLARFLISHINDGCFRDRRILQQNTIGTIFTVQIDSSQLPTERGSLGLTWYRFELETGDLVWGHYGGDPGVTTLMQFRPADGIGVIIFANTDCDQELTDIAARLYHEALTL